jgi:hypothetical protein
MEDPAEDVQLALEPSQPVAKEAVSVLTAVCVSITHSVVFVVNKTESP